MAINEADPKIFNGDSGRPIRIVETEARMSEYDPGSMYDHPESLSGDTPAFPPGHSVGEAKLTDSPGEKSVNPTFGRDEKERPINFAQWAKSVTESGKTFVEVTHCYGRVMRVLGTPFEIIRQHQQGRPKRIK